MGYVQKYKRANVILGSVSADQMSADVSTLLTELDKFESEIDSLSADLARVDKSISEFRASLDNVTDAVAGLSNSSLFSNNSRGVFGVVGLGTKLCGKYTEEKRRREAIQEYNRNMDALLQTKCEIADEKLPRLLESYGKFSEMILPKIEALYHKEFDAKILLDDSLLGKKCQQFKKSLCIVIKSRFIGDTMKYCIEEMRAWKRGKHNSSMAQPSIERELTEEFSSWPSKFGRKEDSWDSMMMNAVHTTSGEMPIPVVTVLSDPCLLRNYVGVSIGESGNCPDAIIRVDDSKSENINPIVTSNGYYLHCKNIFENDYVAPRKAAGFGIVDFIKLMLLPLAFFVTLILLFHIEHSTFWRIFFQIPLLCWLGLGIEWIEQHYDDYFPYVSKLLRYNESMKDFRKGIIAKENCKQFHIIG